MAAIESAWIVRDRSGRLLADFAAGTRLEVARKIVPQRYDAFRLAVSPSYRALFDRALARILAQEGWQIVRCRLERGSPPGTARA